MQSAIILRILYLNKVAQMIFLRTTPVVADEDDSYCPCYTYVFDDKVVSDCKDRNLTTIPNCIPNNTYILEFGHNALRYSPGQFERFENICTIAINSNDEFAARVDSFQSLFGLRFLDLAFTDMTYLTGETFRDQSNLIDLDLQGRASQINWSQSPFDHLENLEGLTLGYDSEVSIPNLSFVKLPSLILLEISLIKVLQLQNHTFSGLSALKYLYLRNPLNAIHLPDEVFKPLINLKKLHLEGLCSTILQSFDCTILDERLQHVPFLKILYIDKMSISHLGKGFLSLKNLEELYLVNSFNEQTCLLAELKADTFKNLNNSVLTKLVLNHCHINILWQEWYKYLIELRDISLSVTTNFYDNFWVAFSFGLENTSICEVRLSLASTNTYAIPVPFTIADGFNHTKLRYFELTDTKFYSLNDSIITKLPKSLTYLNLTHNYIIHFEIDSLKYLENLEKLDLSNQVDFNEQSFKYKYEYEHFSSHINQLQGHFNVSKTKCLSLPHRLEMLDLSKSRLLCNMVPAFCSSNNSLRVLNASLQRERLCFKTRSFWSVLKNLAKLEELDLNGNWISEIPQDAFSGLYKLRILNMVNNKLMELSFDVNDLMSLGTLALSANSIQYASNSFTSQIEEVSWETNLTLYLNINPLTCNCEQFDFVAWLIVTKVISDKNKLKCTSENGSLISVGKMSHIHHILKYKCTRLDVTIGCTVMFWGLNLILGGLAYILHNRQKLRYLVSYGRRTLNPYHPIEDYELEMEYDAYISFEGDFYVTRDKTLRDFVIYTILPGLEQRGIRVKIREDLDAGRNLYEIITETVRRSKKVVVFLTNEYCNDMWNVFEFNQAVMEGIYTNRQVAIPVLFESLRRDNVKEEICEFLKMEPVHKYSPELSDRAFIDFLYERIRYTRQFG